MSFATVTLSIISLSCFQGSAFELPRSGKESKAQDESSPTSDALQTAKFTRHQSLEYVKYSDDKRLVCDVYVPSGKGPFPTILMIHGGAWKSGTKLQMKGHAEAAAKKGFVAVAINYRHAPQYKWPSQYEDCRRALAWMKENADKYKMDLSRLACWGYSAGGHLATYLATRPEALPKETSILCAVCGGGPVDLTLVDQDFPFLVYFLGATRRAKPETYEEASPITFLSKNDPPLFFYHGENDILVPVEGVRKMVDKAKQLGVQCELMTVPNKEHLLTFFDQKSFEKGLSFIERQLKQKVDRD